MELSKEFVELEREEIHNDPLVFTIKNFLTPMECDHMINIFKR